MGREVRMVPADWAHPTNASGNYIALHEGPFESDDAKWVEEAAQWERGFRRDFVDDNKWIPRTGDQLTMSFEEWHGERPVREEYMPTWPAEERTHFQMYENTSEGTPISPPMPTPEALARWLVDNNASSFADMTATYEQWLAMIRAGSSVGSAVMTNGRIVSGVAAVALESKSG